MDEGRGFVDWHLRAYLGQLSPSLSRETARHKTQMARDFLAHLAAIGVIDLHGIDSNALYAYVRFLATRCRLEAASCSSFGRYSTPNYELGLADVAGWTLFFLIGTDKRGHTATGRQGSGASRSRSSASLSR